MPNPDFHRILENLSNAAKDKDSERVRKHLDEMLKHDYQSAIDALDLHRDDDEASFILKHLDISRDDNDNWIASVKIEN